MDHRVALSTLGVLDLEKSTAFFEQLGWRRSVAPASGVSFFQCGCVAVSSFLRPELAKDAGISPSGAGFGGFSVAYNTRSKKDVDAVLSEAKSAGARNVKPAQETSWGGYSGYLRDLDGHLWEVAWNPGFPLNEDGAVSVPD